ncbi:hypothetical protein ANCCEY_11178 [Ancylostoma ceylanicum]|uniref:Uncharacterized protein n=1 Tax=Ancylostoma ceylanicum TaxID=53326 RepID=A0A0D6LEU4_9BILA|nr:hypothetical protein ANCCEY_11178 [Ancylostoma ceylanicum]
MRALNITEFVSNADVLWAHYGGKKPLAVPVCGFEGEKCNNFFTKNLAAVISVAVVVVLVIFLLVLLGFHFWRQKAIQEKKINMKWLVPFSALQEVNSKMCEIDHDNINRFIGLTIHGATYLTLWKFCSRGSLRDVIAKGSANMDGFFMYCLIREIANVSTK